MIIDTGHLSLRLDPPVYTLCLKNGGACSLVFIAGCNAALDVVAAMEDSTRAGAGAHGYYKFWFRHLFVDADKPVLDLARDRAAGDDHVGVARRRLEEDAEALDVEPGGQGGDDLDVASVAGAGVEVEDPGRLDPRPPGQLIEHVNSL